MSSEVKTTSDFQTLMLPLLRTNVVIAMIGLISLDHVTNYDLILRTNVVIAMIGLISLDHVTNYYLILRTKGRVNATSCMIHAPN